MGLHTIRDKMKLLLPLALCTLPLLTSGGVTSLSDGYVTGGTSSYSTTLEDDNVKFAVKAINDFYKDNRTATSLVSASGQVVAGYMYRYIIEVTDSNSQKWYCKAAVWVRSWMTPSKQLYNDPECTKMQKLAEST